MILASSFFLLQAASLAVALGIGRGSVGWDAARQASVQITSGNSPLRMRRSDHAAEGSPNSTSAGLRNVRVRTDGAGASAAGQPREMTVVRFKETPTVCETTPDVRSLAGYVDLDDDAHVFFWFFEARKTPETAPVTLWLNGGPGSDSLVGLFEEIGPCSVNPDLTTSLNPFSWSEYSNLLFLSQPVGVGFSYGTVAEGMQDGCKLSRTSNSFTAPYRVPLVNSSTVGTTQAAAIAAWSVIQAVFQELPNMSSRVKSRDFNLWTESYGGHYGPTFFRYFYKQNELIESGEAEGIKLNLKGLGIINGIIDAAVQFPSYPEFARNNTYGIKAVDENTYIYMSFACYMLNGCLQQVERCKQFYSNDPTSTLAFCTEAANMCRDNVEGPYYQYSGRNAYDIRREDTSSAIPDFFAAYLNLPEIQEALGVQLNYSINNEEVYRSFQQTGDYVYPNYIEDLGFLLDHGVRVVLVYGDADYIGNWFGGEAVSLALKYSQNLLFRNAPYVPLALDGEHHGRVREYGNFSFVVVENSGHLVPSDQPNVALEIFRRTLAGRDIANGTRLINDEAPPFLFPPDEPYSAPASPTTTVAATVSTPPASSASAVR